LSLTQNIEDGVQNGLVTGAVFVDLSAAYDTVNHRRLIGKLYKMTKNLHLAKFMHIIFGNRRFTVELNNRNSRWCKQSSGLLQAVSLPQYCLIYTSTEGTQAFLYVDDLCTTAQAKKFDEVKTALTGTLSALSSYYSENHLRVNPSKTQSCVFHLQNHEAPQTLDLAWNGMALQPSPNPIYLGVTLDRTLSYKEDVIKLKAKVNIQNKIISKSVNL